MAERVKWRSEREGRTGRYRGVAIEVVRWRSLNADGTPYEPTFRTPLPEWTWNYYLHIPIAMLPERLWAAFDTSGETMWGRHVGHRAPDLIESLPWHGGLTLWEKNGGVDGVPVSFKAGCDYAHYWDEGQRYSIESVAFDAQRTVDALWEAIPDLRVRCSWDGRYVPVSEGSFNESGGFLSNEGAKLQAASREEYASREAAS